MVICFIAHVMTSSGCQGVRGASFGLTDSANTNEGGLPGRQTIKPAPIPLSSSPSAPHHFGCMQALQPWLCLPCAAGHSPPAASPTRHAHPGRETAQPTGRVGEQGGTSTGVLTRRPGHEGPCSSIPFPPPTTHAQHVLLARLRPPGAALGHILQLASRARPCHSRQVR